MTIYEFNSIYRPRWVSPISEDTEVFRNIHTNPTHSVKKCSSRENYRIYSVRKPAKDTKNVTVRRWNIASASLSTTISVSGLLTLYVLSTNAEFIYHNRFNDPFTNKGMNKSFSPLSKVRSSRTFNYLMKGTHYILGCLKVRIISICICRWWNTEYLNFEYSLAFRLDVVILRVTAIL